MWEGGLVINVQFFNAACRLPASKIFLWAHRLKAAQFKRVGFLMFLTGFLM